MKQPHNLDKKHTGKPSAGNPHAGFDEAGIGNGSMVALLGHSRQETGSNRSAQPKEPRQSTLLGDERALQKRSNDSILTLILRSASRGVRRSVERGIGGPGD